MILALKLFISFLGNVFNSMLKDDKGLYLQLVSWMMFNFMLCLSSIDMLTISKVSKIRCMDKIDSKKEQDDENRALKDEG